MRFNSIHCCPWTARFLVIVFWVLTMSATHASAVETEVRDFGIEVDGKNSGQYVMTITRQDDGTLSMHADASLKVKALLYTYEYTFTGTEHWKDGRLIQMSSKCNDDGTKYDLFAEMNGQSLRLRVNGKERACRGDVWTTSYWKLADQRFHNQAVPLLDGDSGKEFVGQLQYVGVKQVTINNQPQNCYLFRVTGGPVSPIDLFYDGQHRLVRQEFTEQGKRIVFQLRSVKR
jgi:hypothetical protein